MPALLEAGNVHKTIGDHHALRGIDVVVEAGEIVVLLGPNGVGKTLLLCCLSGGLELTAGCVSILGRPLPQAKRSVSLLLQESMAIGYLTGEENIKFYTALHPESTGGWQHYIETFGLAPALDTDVRDFSGGMKRQLELAITLGAEVPVYLLDEPTSGLDLGATRVVHDAVLAERDRGKAVLLSSHRPLDMEVADRVVFLADGVVTGRDTPSALLEDLPDVVRIRGSISRLSRDITGHFLGGQLFERGDEARGFLRTDTDISHIEEVIAAHAGEFHVATEPPSFVDLFHYQTTVRTEVD